MPRAWKQVEADPEFTKLPDEEKDKVRSLWLDRASRTPEFSQAGPEVQEKIRRRVMGHLGDDSSLSGESMAKVVWNLGKGVLSARPRLPSMPVYPIESEAWKPESAVVSSLTDPLSRAYASLAEDSAAMAQGRNPQNLYRSLAAIAHTAMHPAETFLPKSVTRIPLDLELPPDTFLRLMGQPHLTFKQRLDQFSKATSDYVRAKEEAFASPRSEVGMTPMEQATQVPFGKAAGLSLLHATGKVAEWASTQIPENVGQAIDTAVQIGEFGLAEKGVIAASARTFPMPTLKAMRLGDWGAVNARYGVAMQAFKRAFWSATGEIPADHIVTDFLNHAAESEVRHMIGWRPRPAPFQIPRPHPWKPPLGLPYNGPTPPGTAPETLGAPVHRRPVVTPEETARIVLSAQVTMPESSVAMQAFPRLYEASTGLSSVPPAAQAKVDAFSAAVIAALRMPPGTPITPRAFHEAIRSAKVSYRLADEADRAIFDAESREHRIPEADLDKNYQASQEAAKRPVETVAMQHTLKEAQHQSSAIKAAREAHAAAKLRHKTEVAKPPAEPPVAAPIPSQPGAPTPPRQLPSTPWTRFLNKIEQERQAAGLPPTPPGLMPERPTRQEAIEQALAAGGSPLEAAEAHHEATLEAAVQGTVDLGDAQEYGRMGDPTFDPKELERLERESHPAVPSEEVPAHETAPEEWVRPDRHKHYIASVKQQEQAWREKQAAREGPVSKGRQMLDRVSARGGIAPKSFEEWKGELADMRLRFARKGGKPIGQHVEADIEAGHFPHGTTDVEWVEALRQSAIQESSAFQMREPTETYAPKTPVLNALKAEPLDEKALRKARLLGEFKKYPGTHKKGGKAVTAEEAMAALDQLEAEARISRPGISAPAGRLPPETGKAVSGKGPTPPISGRPTWPERVSPERVAYDRSITRAPATVKPELAEDLRSEMERQFETYRDFKARGLMGSHFHRDSLDRAIARWRGAQKALGQQTAAGPADMEALADEFHRTGEAGGEQAIAYGPNADMKAIGEAIAEDVRQGISPSASGLAEAFLKAGKAPLSGAAVNNARSVDEVVRLIRNRQVEVLGVRYKVEGEGVGTRLYSAGQANLVLWDRETIADVHAGIEDLKAQNPGKHVTFEDYHNHPRGDPTLSLPDLETSSNLRKEFGEYYDGSGATDDTEYEFTKGLGDQKRIPYSKPMEAFPARGTFPVGTPEEAAALAFKNIKKGSANMVIYRDNSGKSLAVVGYDKSVNILRAMKVGKALFRSVDEIVVSLRKRGGLPVSEYGQALSGDVSGVFAINDRGEITSPVSTQWLGGRVEAHIPTTMAPDLSDVKTWRLMENPPPFLGGAKMPADEFKRVLADAKVDIDSTLTARNPFEGIKKGQKVRVINISYGRGTLQVQAEGQLLPVETRPGNFVEIYPYLPAVRAMEQAEQATGDPTMTMKQLAELATKGPPPSKVDLDMRTALRVKLKAEQTGSYIGARQAARVARDKLYARLWKLKYGEAAMDEARRYIKDHVPPARRWRYLDEIASVKKMSDMFDVIRRADFNESIEHKKSLFRDIQALAQRIEDSPSVSVSAKQEARRVVLQRLGGMKFADAAGIEEAALEAVRNALRILDEIGRGQLDAKKELREMTKEALAQDIIADSIPINKIHDPIPLDPKDPAEYTTWALIKRGSGHIANFFQTMWYVKNSTDVIFSSGSKTGGYMESAVWNAFKMPLDAGYRMEQSWAESILDPIVDLIRGKGMTEAIMHNIGINATAAQETGIEKLMNSEWAQRYKPIEVHKFGSEIRKTLRMSPAEREVLEKWRELNNQVVFPLLKKYAEDVLNIELAPEPDYFPFHTMHDADREADVHHQVLDSMSWLDKNPKSVHYRKKTERGFTIKREGAGKQITDTNFIRVITRHVRAVAHMIFTQEPLSLAYEIAMRDDVKAAMGSLKWREVMGTLDLVARAGGLQGQDSRSLLDIMRRNFSRAEIPGRIPTWLVHGTKVMPVAGFFGPAKTLKAGKMLMADDGWYDFLRANFPVYRRLIGDDPSFDALGRGILKPTELAGKVRELAAWGTTPLVRLNGWSAAVSLMTAYADKMRNLGLPLDKSKPDQRAIAFAELWMRRTQDSPQYQDMPPLLSRGAGWNVVFGKSGPTWARLFQQFTLYPLAKWSMIENDVIRLGLFNGKPGRLVTVLPWIAAQTALDAGIRVGIGNGWMWLMAGIGTALGMTVVPYELRRKRGFTSKHAFYEEWKDRFYEEALKTIPFYPVWAHSLLSERPFDSSIPAMQIFAESMKAIKATTNHKIEDDMRAMMSAEDWNRFNAAFGEAAQQEASGVMASVRAISGAFGAPFVTPITELWRMAHEQKIAFPYHQELSRLSERRKHDAALPEKDWKLKHHMTEDDNQRYEFLSKGHKDFAKAAAFMAKALNEGNMRVARMAAEGAAEIVRKMEAIDPSLHPTQNSGLRSRERIKVGGKVQGVGFRKWLQDYAQQLGVGGRATNMRDGTLQVEAEGHPAAISTLKEHLGQGPDGARVDSIQSETAPVNGRADFEVGDER